MIDIQKIKDEILSEIMDEMGTRRIKTLDMPGSGSELSYPHNEKEEMVGDEDTDKKEGETVALVNKENNESVEGETMEERLERLKNGRK